LVFLDREDVIPTGLKHLLAKVPVGEHAIARDDFARHRQDPQQFQGGLMLVGLGLDPHLRQHGMHVRSIGRKQVDSWRLTVTTATGGLAVEGQVRGVIGMQAGLNPLADAGLEVSDVDAAEDPRIGRLAEAPSHGEPEQAKKVRAPLLAEFDNGLVAGHPREHGDDSQRQECREGVSLAPGPSRIVNSLKEFHQSRCGIHSWVLIYVSSRPINGKPYT
jgi:hypothetical protein